MQLPPEYFENKKQQAHIKNAMSQAIPEGVYYHNLIIAFAEMMADFTRQAFKEDVYSKSTETPERSE